MAGRRKRGPAPILEVYKLSLRMFCRRRLAAAHETKAVGIKPVESNGRNFIVTIILTGECGLSLLIYARECIRSSSVCPSEPIGDRAGWHPGRPRRDRRRDRRRARVCRARADGRRLMNERDPTKDRRRRRFTPADIRQIRHYAAQYGLAYWARHYSVSVVAIWKIVHKKSYIWVED
jgi:hypothetical protein